MIVKQSSQLLEAFTINDKKEWTHLILKAKNDGLTPNDVRLFFQKKHTIARNG